jgi:4-amino-4-deoxy-L-arabinose transferase-like glycosyltransferase
LTKRTSSKRAPSAPRGDPGGRSSRAGSTAGRRGAEGAFAGQVALALVIAMVLLSAIVRWRLADVPLERDEGEYAYAGQLVLRGIPPYQLAYNMKFPGTYYAYALSMAAFGQTPRGIRLGLIVVNALTTLLVFAIGRRLGGRSFGAIAAIAFALLSLDRWIMGVFAHATHYVLLPLLAGLYLLIRAPRTGRALSLLAAGVLLGVAVIVKQHAVLFLPLGAFLVLWGDVHSGRRTAGALVLDLGILTAGAILPFAVLCGVLLRQGVFGGFWFWTIQYAREYVTEYSMIHFIPSLVAGLRLIMPVMLPLWLIAGAGAVALWLGRWRTTERVFITGLLVAAFLSACLGLYFRQHYFILMLPAVALLCAVAFASVGHLLERALPARVSGVLAALLFAVVAVVLVARQSDFLFSMTPRELSRALYHGNPFIESVEIARYIRERTTKDDRIAVLGSEPEIYFYADRLSATGYIYTYPLMERQRYAARMQAEMMRQIEAAHPAYIVFVQVPVSWLSKSDTKQNILAWANRYLPRCYDRVGVVETLSDVETHYAWDAEAATYTPNSENVLYVLRRRSEAPCTSSP